VNLTVTNTSGSDSLRRTNYITVSAPPSPPVAAFTAEPLSGTVPLGVTFTDSSSGTSLTNWRWDFGDGNISEYDVSTHPFHIYESSGMKTVNLTVTGSGGTDSQVRTNLIDVLTPEADFSGTPLTGVAPLGVAFTDNSAGASITNWRWDFGDGNISEYTVRTDPFHIYESAGLKTINLTVTGTGGTDSEVKMNYVGVLAQEAGFSAAPVTGYAPLGVAFTDNSAGASITNRIWDFGDGNISEYTTRTDPYHIYSSPGLYSINLTINGAEGSDSEVKTGYISIPAQEADFSAAPVTGNVPLGVTFTDNSTGLSITTWIWDFGDGNISEYGVRTDPFHIYSSPGTYSVNVTVIATGGSDIEIKTNYIAVTAAPVIPVADFTANLTSGTAPLDVMFTDLSAGTGISAWSWDFNNDGIVDSTIQSPIYTFSSAGIYTINLTVTGTAGGDNEIKSGFINVTNIPVIPPIPQIGVFRNATGSWYTDTTMTGVVNTTFPFGKPGDIPVVGDWDANTVSDAGIFRPST
jgi:PKD repeat protein